MDKARSARQALGATLLRDQRGGEVIECALVARPIVIGAVTGGKDLACWNTVNGGT